MTKNNFKSLTVFLAAGVIFFTHIPVYAYRYDHHDRHGRYEHHERYYRYRDRPRYGMEMEFIPGGYSMVRLGHGSYYYYDGLYYMRHGYRYVLVAPPVGAVVSVIPQEYEMVNINGVTYYTDSGIYYVRRGHRRYQVVEAPVVIHEENKSKVVEGIGVGAIVGAAAGGIIGHNTKGRNGGTGALIGAATGAVVGGLVGAQIPNESAASVESAQTIEPQENSYTVNVPNKQGGSYTPVVLTRSGKGYVGPQGEYYDEFPSVEQLRVLYAK